MPAAAVIPALIAYIKIAAVKTLVVGFQGGEGRSAVEHSGACSKNCIKTSSVLPSGRVRQPFTGSAEPRRIGYFEQIRVFKAGILALNTLAWNNKMGL